MSDSIQDQIAALKEQVAQLEKKAAEDAANKKNIQHEAAINSEDTSNEMVKSDKADSPLIKWLTVAAFLLVALVTLAALANKPSESSNQDTYVKEDSTNADRALEAAINATDAATKAAEDAIKTSQDTANNSNTKWYYKSLTDGMDDLPTKLACVESEDMITQTFPYESAHTELCIRKSPKEGLDAFFRLQSEGQILCHSYSEPCVIRVRFDSGSVQSFSGLSASDNSSNIVFFQNSERMLNSILKSKQTRVQVELYQNGIQTTTFNTSGLVWPPK